MTARPGSSVRHRGRALFLAALVVSQVLALGAPAVASAAVTPALGVGLYHGNGGSSFQGFNGNGSAYPNPQDLTQWGSGDWRLWGLDASASASGLSKDRAGRSLIGDLAAVPPTSGPAAGLAGADGVRPFTFGWSDGAAPNPTGSAALAGIKPVAGGEGAGLQLRVPLPRQIERLRLWVSAYEGTGVLTASIPDGPTVTNTEMVGKTNDHGGVFEIDVQGSGDLTVTFTLTCPQAGGCTANSHVTVYAAAYTWTGASPSFSVDVTAGQPADFTVVEGDTTPRTSKVTTTAINPPLTQVTLATSVTTAAGEPGTGLSASVSPATVSTFPATSDVTITPAVGVAAGTYHVTVTGIETDGATDVNTANFTVTVLPRTQVPFLYRAFPNDPGYTNPSGAGIGGGVTVEGLVHGSPNQTYRVQFSTATACSDGRVAGGTLTAGPTVEVPTDGQGDAYLVNAIAIPAGTAYVTARVVAYRSATTPVVVWTSLGDTAYGPCIVVSEPNESWPWALPISATGGVVDFTTSQYLDDVGRSRWYRFEIQPGSRAHITVDGLPKDYDAYLFRDIRQAYEAGGSLLQQSAEYAPPSYAPPSYAPPSYAPDSLAPPSYAPPSYAPPSYAPPSYAPPSYAPPSYAADAWAPPSYAPPSYALYDATNYASAQTGSLIAWNVEEGTLSATIDANTWTNTGEFYVRVSGKNGQHDVTRPFHIAITTDPSVCAGVQPAGTAPVLGTASDATSVILWNSERIVGTAAEKTALGAKLTELAGRSGVDGAVVDLATDPAFSARINALDAQADAHPDCVYAKNLVASAARDVVTAYRQGNSRLAYVVLAGGDDSIPFFRYPDPAYLGPESDYVPPVKRNSASEASLRSNYVLGQDEYGASTVLDLGPSRVPVPDLAVGRLVETAPDIVGLVDAYSPAAAGAALATLEPASALVTGYDFLADAAHAVSDQLAAGLPQGASTQRLITEYGMPQTSGWTADDLRGALLGQRHDLVFLAGHFSANEALAADFSTRVDVKELAASSVDLARTVVFSNGCHSGYSLVDRDAITGVTEPLDWAQAFARKGATLVAGTGYQYGDTDFLEYSERIYAEFAHQLRVGTGPVAVGDALVASKLAYLGTTQSISGLHEKAVLEAALFGLPMFKVQMTGTRDTSAGSGPESLTFGPADAEGGLTWSNLATATTTTPHAKSLTLIGGGNVSASWLSGDDGVSLNPGDPVLPLDIRNVTVAGRVLRGVVWMGGDYTDTEPVVPLTATAGTELGGTHLTFGSPTFYPERPWSVNYFDELAGDGGATSLLLTPAQHRVVDAGGTDALVRRYGDLGVRLYYLASSVPADGRLATALAPSISNVGATIGSGDQVTFRATVVGDPVAGPLHAWILYTLGPDQAGHGSWVPVELTAPAGGSGAWTRTVTVPGATLGNLRFLAQAVGKGGAVSIDTNLGRYYGAWETPPISGTSLTLSTASAPYGDTLDATARLLDAGGNGVAGKTITFRLGSVTATAQTGADGTATARLPLAVTPGAYTAYASFAGDATQLPSSATRSVQVTRIATTTAIALTPGVALKAGAESGVTATVRDANGDPLDFRTVFFVVAAKVGAGGYSVTRLTDGTGTASLGRIPTPFVGDKAYTITAYYATPFTSVPDGSVVDTTDLIYQGSQGSLPYNPQDDLIIGKGDQVISFADLPDNASVGDTQTLSASANSGLPVSFAVSTPLTCSLGATTVEGGVSTSVLTILAAGTCTITASQPATGDETWNPAPDASQTITATQAIADVTLTCPAGTLVYTGVAQPCTATAAGVGGQPVTVAVTYNGAATEPLGAGTYAVVATVSDPRYQGQASALITIGKSTLTVTPAPISLTVGSPVPAYPFTVTGFRNGETAQTATGYVAPACTSGYTTATPVSSQPLTITCSGGSAANYVFDTTATAQLVVTATPTAITSLTMTPIAPNPTAQFGDTVTLRAVVSPSVSGTVTFRVNGRPAGGVTATVSGGVAQATLRLDGAVLPDGAGDYALTASFVPSSATYAPSGETSVTVAVAREGQQAGGQPDGSSRIESTGDQFVVVGAIPTLRATLLQSRPPELADAELVDLASSPVDVVFTVYPAACPAGACPAAVWTSGPRRVQADGSASATPPSAWAEGAYVVSVAAVSNRFVRPLVATSTIAVSSAGTTFIGGGGFVTTDSTSKVENPRGHFAFDTYKTNSTVLGSVVYVYRMRVNVTDGGTQARIGTDCTTLGPVAAAGCRDVDVVIRNTSLATLNGGQKGYVTGKALVQVLDAADPSVRYAALEPALGDFRLDIIDNSQAGTTSAFGLTAYTSTGKVFHEAYAGGSRPVRQSGIKSVTNTVLIGGGYISSHP